MCLRPVVDGRELTVRLPCATPTMTSPSPHPPEPDLKTASCNKLSASNGLS